MGFLHKLWDETLAGPPPETGLGKLRKFDSFSATRSPPVVADHDQVVITRSITILKGTNVRPGFRNLSVDAGSVPDSPIGSSNPGTPLTPGTPSGDFKTYTRTKMSADAETGSSTPTAYDWIMISALDR